MTLEVINLAGDNPDTLNLPFRELPEIKKQLRKKSASASLSDEQIMGADTETIEGRVWLFSTELGVWEIGTLGDLLGVLYDPIHARTWKQGAGKKRRFNKGISTRQFFFWNLRFDAQAILHLLKDDEIDQLIEGDEISTWAHHPEDGNIEVKIRYIEGKHLRFKPVDWFRGDSQHKVGPCDWWDISQFYGKTRLKTAAKKAGLPPKIEICKIDGSILDASRFDDPYYRDFYMEDILEYAVHDAVLAGDLARLKRDDFVNSDIRFIQPYSLANVAVRKLLDTCQIPRIDPYLLSDDLLWILKVADTSYQGGGFETTGSGFHPDGTAGDLASAYPYVMCHLPDTNAGYWVKGDEDDSWWDWIDERQPYSLGFAEAYVIFDEGLPIYPLVKKSSTGTLVAPRIIQGWFTADELAEARKWPHSTFIIGSWTRFVEDDTQNRPFLPYMESAYEMKWNAEKGSPEYGVSKILLSSIYGKTRQATNGKAGKIWNPMYASTICGATRARCAELIRLNDFTALSVATDGVIFPTESFHTIPDRPLPAPHNMGNWELEGRGELLIAMSGVYSMSADNLVKTVFRGSAALFLRGYEDGGLFRFCEDNDREFAVQIQRRRPISAKEARMKKNFGLMNQFIPRGYRFAALGDSTKRLWPEAIPRSFGDLLEDWWPSTPHRDIEEGPMPGEFHE